MSTNYYYLLRPEGEQNIMRAHHFNLTQFSQNKFMWFLLANNCNALRHTLPCKSHSPVTGVWLFHITSNPLARIFHIWSHLFSFSWSAWSVTPGLRSASSSSCSAQVSMCHTRQKTEPPDCIIPSSILSASPMSPAPELPQGLLCDDI